jgi:SecD/SecF fusion protein
MQDPNRAWKWAFVVLLVVIALVVLYPPKDTLKGGIDLVGGTSLTYEVDTSGLSAQEKRGLAEAVMDVLKQRVDPGAQRNLEWRPIGNNRLEIRMPMPPAEARERRQAFDDAMKHLKAMNVWRSEVESALSTGEDRRDHELAKLVRGVSERTELFNELKAARDELKVAQDELKAAEDAGADDTSALRELVDQKSTAYEEAFTKVLGTSLPETRLKDVLAIESEETRKAELDKLKEAYPAYNKPVPSEAGEAAPGVIDQIVEAYDAWAKYKGDLEDPSDLKRLLRGAGVLEFRILADRDMSSPGQLLTSLDLSDKEKEIATYVDDLQKYGPRFQAGRRFRWFEVQDVVGFMDLRNISEFETKKELYPQIVERYAGKYYVLAHNDPQYSMLVDRRQGGAKWQLKNAWSSSDPDTGGNIVLFELDVRGGSLFSDLTGNNIGRQLCIMLDDLAMSHARIASRIATSGRITGDFDLEELGYLVRTLRAGALPAKLKETPLMEKTIGPSLGQTNRTMGFRAAVIGGVVVMVFVLFYYGIVAGGMADIALALNLLFVLAVMALMQATFTLPGIAALILTVGMAIDANVLIFERFREERDRGVVFKKALNAGYDKALSTIVDANLTTLITCVILGLVSTEEVKGFATVLGIGIVTSMFTALFVTRLVFNTLIAKGMLKELKMRRLIRRPTIDWVSLRTKFWPISIVLVIGGIGLFLYTGTTDKEGLYDIEFLGGTSVQLDLLPGAELKPGTEPDEKQVNDIITNIDRPSEEGASAVQWLLAAADHLEAAKVAQGQTVAQFTVESPDLTGEDIISMMTETLRDVLARGGANVEGRTAIFDLRGQRSLEDFRGYVSRAVAQARKTADLLRKARVQLVENLSEEAGSQPYKSFDVATVATDRGMVQAAILAVLGDRLQVQRAKSYTLATDEVITRGQYFPIEEADNYLHEVLDTEADYDIRRFKGGVAVKVFLDETELPMAVEEFEARLREVRLREEFSEYGGREFSVLPLGAPKERGDGARGYMRFAVVAADPSVPYQDDQSMWAEIVAEPQVAQVKAALGSEKSLTKVVQFAPQIAGQTQRSTVFAIVLALMAIVAYVWLRFGTMQFGLAAIVALVHDVCITLGAVAVSHYLYGSIVGSALGMEDFKIDLPMIAAILTVIGYSLNDTIVVFDRIRENRGKAGMLPASIINTSINQTLSRTLLTSITTFLVVFVMYVMGGSGIKGFSYALLIGVIIGTYSSVGVATPLLYRPKVLNAITALIAAIGVVALIFAALGTGYPELSLILSIVAVALCAWFAVRQNMRLSALGAPAGAGA